MESLQQKLGIGTRRLSTIRDTVKMIDEEVKAKGGISGFAIRSAYATVKKIKPGFVASAVDYLLDGFLESLEPFWKENPTAAGIKDGLLSFRSRAAEALLGVTDRKALTAKTAILKSLYRKLRPLAKSHVETAIPRLANMLRQNLEGTD